MYSWQSGSGREGRICGEEEGQWKQELVVWIVQAWGGGGRTLGGVCSSFVVKRSVGGV